MFKKVLSPILISMTLTGFSSASLADDWPDDIRDVGPHIDVFNNALSYTGSTSIHGVYRDIENNELKKTGSENFTYWQRRHKIEGQLDGRDDIDIIPVKFPQDYYMSFNAIATDYGSRDIVVNLFPASMLYSPLENGLGLYRSEGDSAEFEENYESAIDGDVVYTNLGNDFIRYKFSDTYIERLLKDIQPFSQYYPYEVKGLGSVYSTLANKYEDPNDLYFYVISYRDNELAGINDNTKYILFQDFTNVPIEQPQTVNTRVYPEYQQTITNQGYINDGAVLDIFNERNGTVVNERTVSPNDANNLTGHKIYFNGDYNNPKSLTEYNYYSLNEDESYFREPPEIASKNCGQHCHELACTPNNRGYVSYTYASDWFAITDSSVEGVNSTSELEEKASQLARTCAEPLQIAINERPLVISRTNQEVYDSIMNDNGLRSTFDRLLSGNGVFALGTNVLEETVILNETNDVFDINALEGTLDTIEIQLNSNVGDRNINERENYNVLVRNQRTGEVETVTVFESTCEGDFEYRKAQPSESSVCFIGEIEKEKSSEFQNENGVISVLSGDELLITASDVYENPMFPDYTKNLNREFVQKIFEIPELGRFENTVESLSFNEPLELRLIDGNKNIDTTVADKVSVRVTVKKQSGNVHENFTVELTETGANTGIFEKTVPVKPVDNLTITELFDKEINLLNSDSFYTVEVEYTDTDAYFENARYDMVAAEKLSQVGAIFDDQFNGLETGTRPVTYELSYAKNVDAQLDFYNQSSFDLNKNYRIYVVDCNLSVQLGDEAPEVTVENVTKGVVNTFEMTVSGSSPNSCRYETNFNAYSPDFENQNLSGNNVFGEVDDLFKISFIDPKGENEQETVVSTGEFPVKGIYGANASVTLVHEGAQKQTSLSSLNNVYFINGKSDLTVAVRDRDREILKGEVPTSITLRNATKDIEKEFELIYQNPECSVCADDQLSKVISLSSVQNEGDLYLEVGDALSVIYNDVATRNNSSSVISNNLLVKEATDADFSVNDNDNVFYLNSDNEFLIRDIDAADMSRFLGFSDREEYEEVKVTNLRTQESVNVQISTFYSEENLGYIRVLKDVGQTSTQFVSIIGEVGDTIELQYLDLLGSDSVNKRVSEVFEVVESPDDIVEVYSSDLRIGSPFNFFIKDKSANLDPLTRETIEIEATWNYWRYENDERETLTLTESGPDTGLFELTITGVVTDDPQPENGILDLPKYAEDNPDYTMRVNFRYVSETSGQIYNSQKRVLVDVEGVSLASNKEGVRLGETIEVEVLNPYVENSSVRVDAVVTLESGAVWNFTKRLEQVSEGVYRSVFRISEPELQFPDENPENSFFCSGGIGESSVGQIPINATFESVVEEAILCAEDLASVEFFYDFGQGYSDNVTVNGVVPAPVMTVKENLEVNDQAWVEVSDEAANSNSNEIETVYGYVVSWVKPSFDANAQELANDSSEVELESIELIETGPDTGVFETFVPLSLRMDSTPAESDSGIMEVRSTRHDSEYLMFAYNGTTPYEGNNQIPEFPIEFEPTSVMVESASVEDELTDKDYLNFNNYSAIDFVFRDIKGGYSGLMDLSDDAVDIYERNSISVFDLDLLFEGNETIDVAVENQRTGESRAITLELNPVNGVYKKIVEIDSENNPVKDSTALKSRVNDQYVVTYVDELKNDNSSGEVVQTFTIRSGDDASLDVQRNIFVKDTVSIVLQDDDLGDNSSPEVEVLNKRTGEIETVQMVYDTSNEFYYGELPVEFGDEITTENLMGVKSDDVLEFSYLDEENSTPNPVEVTVNRIVNSGFDGLIDLPPYIYIEEQGNTGVTIAVVDKDINQNPTEVDTIDVVLENITKNITQTVTLTEENVNSDVFFAFVSFENNFTIEDGDEVRGIYVDQIDNSGQITEREDRAIVIGLDTYNATLSVPETVEIDSMLTVSVTDLDLNEDSSEIETATVTVTNNRTNESVVVNVTETDVDTGVFSGSVPVQYGVSSIPENNILEVNKDDILISEYVDEENVNGNQDILTDSTIVTSGNNGVLSVDEDIKVNDDINVLVEDVDENKDAENAEQISVFVLNNRTEQEVMLTLTETGIDTGIFEAVLETYYSVEVGEDSGMAVIADDELVFEYTDLENEKGQESTLIERRTLSGGSDGTLIVDNEVFVGNDVNIEVVDADENVSPNEVDNLDVLAENPRTGEQEVVTLTETGSDTGVFKGSLETSYSENPDSENGVIGVINEDDVVITYEDQFNSDGGTTIIEEIVTFIAGFDGEISVTSPNEIGNAMIVTVRDRDLDVSKGTDTVLVVVTNERTKESVEVLLTEQVAESRERTKAVAANDSNPFVGMVYGVNEMVGFGKGSELETFSGDYLVASYVDEINSQGQSETLTAKGLFLGADAIVLDKNALEDSAIVGGLVPYTIEVENVSPNDLNNVEIVDNLPAGFRLAKDFVYVGDDKQPVSANGGVMTVTLDEIDSNETIILTYVLKVSSGVVEGAYENKVMPYIGNILVGNESRATVYVQDDPLFNDALVFGKVFDDANGNGYLDEGEEGIPGVTIAGVDGINVVTDSKGRYSIEGVDGGRMDRGVNYILKVMPETLPEGSEFTTENPRVQRITQGMPSKFNFGVAVPKQGAYTAMVEVRLGEVFFDWDKDNVKEEYKSSLNRIANFIEEQGGGIIIIEGNTDSLGTDEYNEDLALRRASAVYKVLKDYLSDEVYQNIEVKIIK